MDARAEREVPTDVRSIEDDLVRIGEDLRVVIRRAVQHDDALAGIDRLTPNVDPPRRRPHHLVYGRQVTKGAVSLMRTGLHTMQLEL